MGSTRAWRGSAAALDDMPHGFQLAQLPALFEDLVGAPGLVAQGYELNGPAAQGIAAGRDWLDALSGSFPVIHAKRPQAPGVRGPPM